MIINKNFLFAGLVTAVINLVLHASAYFVFLKDFYASHPVGSVEYLKQLNRPPDQLVIWALLVSALAFGFFYYHHNKMVRCENLWLWLEVWTHSRFTLLDFY
jgi:hypothetical protein